MGIKQAGKELLKANLGNAINQLIKPESYVRTGSSRNVTGIPMEVISLGGDGVGAFYAFEGIGSCLTAYQKCPPLQAVCNKRAQNFIKGKIQIKNSVGKPSTSAAARRVAKLLKNPNPLQTRSLFLAQIHTYIDLVGYAVVLPIKPVGFEMNEADSFWVLPPTMVSLQTTGGKINILTGGIDSVLIGNVNVSPDDVMILTDINPSVDDMIKPGSKIRSLEIVINNIIGAYESESTLIYHRGPSGILSPKMLTGLGPAPVTEDEKLNIMNQAKQLYGLTRGQVHLMITNAAVDYTKTGFSIDELGLHKTIVNGTVAICDTIGYPTELMGIVNPTYNNKQEAGKEAFTKYAIPMAVNIAEQLGSYLLPEVDTITFDYSHVEELQADKKKEAETRKIEIENAVRKFKMNMNTYNQMLVQCGEEPREGYDLFYYELKDTVEFLFDAAPVIQIDNGNTSNQENRQ